MLKYDFKFIDLFAGIGGFRIAFEDIGGKCVLTSEYDKFAQKTYETFFNAPGHFDEIQGVEPAGDVTKLDEKLVPDHDILAGGFPCQPFSLAGVSKKQSMGRPHGFDDPTQGTLFFDIKRIIKEKKPKAILLENVKNLKSHDNHRTFRVIEKTLDELGYDIFPRVIDAKGWVPQHRERIFIPGFRRKKDHPGQTWEVLGFDEIYELEPPKTPIYLDSILEEDVPEKYILGEGTWATLIRHRANHERKGQGFGYGLIKPPFGDKTTRTISARYHKDGAEILIDTEGPRPRRLTPLECYRLMGFPKRYEKYFDRNSGVEQPVSDTQAYRQFGNSVAVPVVQDIAKLMLKKLSEAGAL